ncbi:erythromycin esterase family protein [Streptomyces sudanensis]|uniref:erythromycin esterase family protein n=1 Tax=Streptomyces sudanensis TaxID=436397 RepID=UPI0027E50682|nr:erythromycin esterase family protein [Streptomyces sudanensis]
MGELEPNRRLVAWLRRYNEGRPPHERVALHGFDAPTENTSAPSPRTYLEHARDYLGLDLDLAALAGDDERWSRTEAILDPAASVGATPGAERLRAVADDMLVTLHERAPERIAATSHARWLRALTHLTAGLGLLRYHRQAARPGERNVRIARLLATRDALMAQNLLAVREVEARRGGTLVFAHNTHLQRGASTLRVGDADVEWFGAGAIVADLSGERYAFAAGSVGRSEALGLGEPGPDTFEGFLQGRTARWGLLAASAVPDARTRTDTDPRQGYYPLARATLDGADAVLHIRDGAAITAP